MSITYPSLFEGLFKPFDIPIAGRLRSVEEDDQGKPLLELTKDNGTLILSFIRSKPGYDFKTILNDTLCWAGSNGFTTVKLEDDALFNQGRDCLYRALIYRAFQNKHSIYVDRGFGPKNKSSVERDLKTLFNFPISSAKQLFTIAPPELSKTRRDLEMVRVEGPFGTWLISRPCQEFRAVMNWLLTLSTPSNMGKAPPSTIPFLEAYHNYIEQHKVLTQMSACFGRRLTKSTPNNNVVVSKEQGELMQRTLERMRRTLERSDLLSDALGNVQNFWAQFPPVQWASPSNPLNTSTCNNTEDFLTFDTFDDPSTTVARVPQDDGTFDCFDPDTLVESVRQQGDLSNPLRKGQFLNPYSFQGKW